MEFGSQVVLPAATTPALPQLDVGAIAGLPTITPYVQLEYPLIPAELALEMLHRSQAVGDREILFYLSFINGKWQLDIPKQ